MNWSKVRLIFFRELRDQLRDRRTLFMIAVLPVLLYPLMGMTFLQVAQFLQEHPTRVAVVGAERLPEQPPLLDGNGQFAANLYSEPRRAGLLQVERVDPPSGRADDLQSWVQEAIRGGQFDVVLVIPKNFREQVNQMVQGPAPAEQPASGSPDSLPRLTPPEPELFFSSAKDRSRVSRERLATVLGRWRKEVVERVLVSRRLPPETAEPFVIGDQDIAEVAGRQAALWGKMLPFVLILWAVTGAFYPAIDLCAGEKERGTLETLLSSPAERAEIVWGKLLTVTVFSVATSILNMFSLVITGSLIVSRLQQAALAGEALRIGAPPGSTMIWLIVALLPIAAMFSALSLALATLARSTKEGQYYLMPLMLVTMPLSMIAVMPTAEISLGNTLIPVTGVMLILRALIEGNYLVAAQYSIPVTAVTAFCCYLSIRWAVHQFNDESVLFRESERFSLGVWIRHLVRDRGVTPSLGEAIMCGMLLLILQFFVRLLAPAPTSWSDLVQSTLIVQLALIAAPVLVMTCMLTSSAKHTLLLRPALRSTLLAALLLAVFIAPATSALRELIHSMYPINEETMAVLAEFSKLLEGVPKWQLILLMALIPAICEELAFRGFILSGLRHFGSKGIAILVSALFFGVVHSILQQSINAFFLGLILGYIAVQTGSLLPCIVFHFLHNAIQLVSSSLMTSELLERYPGLGTFFVESQLPGVLSYRAPFVVASILAVGLLLRWFRSLPYSPSPEERLHDALDHQTAAAHS